MNSQPSTRLQVRTPDSLIAAVPHLLGFRPELSMVIVALARPRFQVQLALRFDLPDASDHETADLVAGHATDLLVRGRYVDAVAIGYGPGTLVTPVADRIRQAFGTAGIRLHDLLRVEDGRYWSYQCPDPACCPADGAPLATPCADEASAVLADAGLPVLASRADLAATIAPLTGSEADVMRVAIVRAVQAMRRAAEPDSAASLADGLAAVKHAIATYRDGGSLVEPRQFARLAVSLTGLRVRDDAWARMDPQHRVSHARLWTDVIRRACPGYVAAPASLLAFVAWQCGEGALASIALDRALADDPAYSMARLLAGALAAGLPPSVARLPMTPDEVAASYDRREQVVEEQ